MNESPQLKKYLDESQDDERILVERHQSESTAARISAGNLNRHSFGALLAELHRWRSEGALFLRRGEIKKVVYFSTGRAVMVRSNVVAECLGRVLLRERFISETDCEESLRRLKQTGRAQGAILIEMGSISPHNLVYALQLQLQTKLIEIFRWPDGAYQFDSRAKIPGEPISLELTTAAAIYEGIKRTYGEERVAKELGNVHKLYPAPSPDPLYRFQEIGLDEDEARLLATIDGSRTVAEIAIGGQLPPPATLRFLLAMRTAQVLDFHDEATHDPLPADVRAKLAPDAPKSTPPTVRPNAPSKPPPRLQAEQLLAKVAAMRQQNHFEVLGAAHGTPIEALRPLYMALARDYHPDKHFSAASAQVRELAAEIFGRITVAYEILSDPDERTRYLDSLATPVRPKPKAADDISNILAAEGRFELGKEMLAANKCADAVAAFRESVQLYAGEGEFRAWLGWAVFSEKPQDEAANSEAIQHLEEAIQLSPKLEQAYLFLGRIYKAQGRADRAEREFERALRSNPDSAEALKEIRQLGFR